MKHQIVIEHDDESGQTQMALPQGLGPKVATKMLADALGAISGMMAEAGPTRPQIVVPDVRVDLAKLRVEA